MNFRLKIAPATEPVTLAEAKAHLRVTDSADDSYITTLITAARERIEEMTSRALIEQTWQLWLDAFPQGTDGAIVVPRPRLISVTSLQYVDTAGATQTLAGSEYTVDTSPEPGRVVPAYGKYWPSTRVVPNAVIVEYKAGYGAAAASVPAALRQALLLVLGDLYEHREQSMDARSAMPAPISVMNLIFPYRILQL